MTSFKSTSLADKVFEKLENDIIFGVYPRGEILTELKLVEQLNVSRTPIRWDDTAVSLVIMLSFNPNDRKIFYDIFEPLSMILLDSNNLKGALLCKDYTAFIDFLVEHME